MDQVKLTKEQKSALAEYAAQLGYFDFWYYQEDQDTYNEDGGSLEDCIEFIEKQIKVAGAAKDCLVRLQLV